MPKVEFDTKFTNGDRAYMLHQDEVKLVQIISVDIAFSNPKLCYITYNALRTVRHNSCGLVSPAIEKIPEDKLFSSKEDLLKSL